LFSFFHIFGFSYVCYIKLTTLSFSLNVKPFYHIISYHMDQNIECYRIIIHSKKWWRPLFACKLCWCYDAESLQSVQRVTRSTLKRHTVVVTRSTLVPTQETHCCCHPLNTQETHCCCHPLNTRVNSRDTLLLSTSSTMHWGCCTPLGRVPHLDKHVQPNVTYNGKDHIIQNVENQRVCPQCCQDWCDCRHQEGFPGDL